jgi:large subunit ribosomal protein L4
VEKKSVRKARKAGIPKVRASAKDGFSAEISVYDMKGKAVETFMLDKGLFTGKVNKAALYQAVLMYSANARQGNAATKTRSDVSGGGKKPWRQKGTGRARAGSTRSPLWRHGGTIFGPHPRDYGYSMPKQLKRAAFLSSINSKLNDKKMIGLAALTMEKPKTKIFNAMLGALKLQGKSLFVLDNMDTNIMRASRNIQKVTVKSYKDFNTMDVLKCDNLVVSKAALEKLPERLK